MIPHLVAGALIFGGFYLYDRFRRKGVSTKFGITNSITNASGVTLPDRAQNPRADTIPWPPISSWKALTIDGIDYLVSPTYIAPIGIGEAVTMVKEHGL